VLKIFPNYITKRFISQVRYLVRKLKASFPYRKDVDYSKQITKKMKSVSEADAALDSEPEDIESDDDEVHTY
jgi:hypothetical protein